MTLFRGGLLRWTLMLAAVLICKTAAGAAVIHLKDGSRIETERVWESACCVHFILEGTQDVEVRYARTIVKNIEKSEKASNCASAANGSVLPTQPGAAKQSTTIALPSADIHKGLLFYDPRRTRKYWAAKDSRHTSLDAALVALADQYGRSIAWVEQHMGDSNDLSQIHRQLFDAAGGRKTTSVPAADTAVPTSTDESKRLPEKIGHTHEISAGLLFYDPRRPLKFWSWPDKGHRSFQSAVEALAAQYQRTDAWVEQHMGDSNELREIHRNLNAAANR